jgi:hypothetical protein
MRVKLKTAVILPNCDVAEAGAELEVSDEQAKDWMERGIAEKPAAAPPAYTPPPQKKK